MFRFEQLEIWKLSIEYAKQCYELTKNFPREELYALTDQLKRAAVSISNNIAEGSTGSKKNFISYLERSTGSALETANVIYFAFLLKYIDEEKQKFMYEKVEELIRKIRSLKKSLNETDG